MKETVLKKKLSELDSVETKTDWSESDLWNSIQEKMELAESKPAMKLSYQKVLPWAAILIAMVGFYFLSESGASPVIVTSETVEFSFDFQWNDDLDLEEGKAFIAESCDKELDICLSPNFQSVYQELQQIELDKEALKSMVEQYGVDELSAKAIIELENVESELTSQLISMILS